MPWDAGTLTPEDVAKFLGVPVDDRLTAATDTSRAWAQRRRCLTEPTLLWSDAAAHDGGVRYAALLYQSHAATSGFPSWEPTVESDYTAFSRAADHVGMDPVIA